MNLHQRIDALFEKLSPKEQIILEAALHQTLNEFEHRAGLGEFKGGKGTVVTGD